MISRQEAHLLLDGWQGSHSLLTVVGQLWGVGFSLECRVAFVSETSVVLQADDGGRIVIDISEPGTEFKYSQPREFPEFAAERALTEEQKFASSLMILFPQRDTGDVTEESAECVSLLEVIRK